MDILVIVILLFIILESFNIAFLYFNPGSRKGNGVGVFNAWEKSKSDPEVHQFVRYLVNWVAGTKLIFILLLIVIVITGDEITRMWSVIALILSIFSFYFRLYPFIRQMDAQGQITPKGYSKMLGMMITGMIVVFCGALLIFLL